MSRSKPRFNERQRLKEVFRLILANSFLTLLCSMTANASSTASTDSTLTAGTALPDAPGGIGETGHFSIFPKVLWFNPYTNDVHGHTDKYLSHALHFGYAAFLAPNLGWESRLHWRMITPSFKKSRSAHPWDEPKGRFADWMEWQNAWAWTTDRWRFQGDLGIGHLGNKGAQTLQEEAHELVGIPRSRFQWSDPITGWRVSRGVEVSRMLHVATPLNAALSGIFSIGHHVNAQREESYLRIKGTLRNDSGLGCMADAKIAKVYRSETHPGIASHRYESGAGCLVWGSWSAHARFVGPIYDQDSQGQLYFEPVNFQMEL